MSDSFSKCDNCGCEEPRTMSPEDKVLSYEKILAHYNKDLEKADETTKKYLEEMKKDIEEAYSWWDTKLRNEEWYCYECESWTTLSWRHVDYHKE